MEEEIATGSIGTVRTKKSDKVKTLGNNKFNQSSQDVYPVSTDGMTIQNSQKAIINKNKDSKTHDETIQTSANMENKAINKNQVASNYNVSDTNTTQYQNQN